MREASRTLSWSGYTEILLVQSATNERCVTYLVVVRLYGDPIGPANNQLERRSLPYLVVSGYTEILLVQSATNERCVTYLVVVRLYGSPIGPAGNQWEMRTIPCRGSVVRRPYWSSRQPRTDAYHTLSWIGCTAILLVEPATNKRGAPYLVVERLYGDPIGPAGNQ